ncbi:hypothetical protein ACTMSW_11245 [Micromonospora sp. BQ11]|uniref:hypothetical protein n=1 Tax=Micromonospora sp. BQ11 TaxID=3452212 RepID=UPI003F88B3AB
MTTEDADSNPAGPPTHTKAAAIRARSVPDTAVNISQQRLVAQLQGGGHDFATSQHHLQGLQTNPIPKLMLGTFEGGGVTPDRRASAVSARQ